MLTVELVAQHLTVRFGHTTALSDISLTVPTGRHLLVYGPAASGKTTLLKVLAGLVRPTEGTLRWGKADVTALSAADRRPAQASFGMVFQSDALFDSMSVLENVTLPLLRRGVPPDEANRRALEALSQVSLSGAEAKRPAELSGGMRKRAGIARAIVARPEVLFADDPFAGLDPDTERSIAALLRSVSNGRTLIVALPDPTESLTLDERLHLRGGQLVSAV